METTNFLFTREGDSFKLVNKSLNKFLLLHFNAENHIESIDNSIDRDNVLHDLWNYFYHEGLPDGQ